MRSSDWSSDVCSSDLSIADAGGKRPVESAPIASPGGMIAARSVDVRAQEDGKSFIWKGPATLELTGPYRSEEHTSELQSLMRNSYAVFCLKKKTYPIISYTTETNTRNLINQR